MHASTVIIEVMEEAPEAYWEFARTYQTFPAIILRPPQRFQQQIKMFREKKILISGSGRTRDPENEYNKVVDQALSLLNELKIQLILDENFMEDPLPESVSEIGSLPPLIIKTIPKWEPILLMVLDQFLVTNLKLADSLKHKAKLSLSGRSDSPSEKMILSEIREEFKKAIRRAAKERDRLLPE